MHSFKSENTHLGVKCVDAEARSIQALGRNLGLQGQRVANCPAHGGQRGPGLLPELWNPTRRSVRGDK